MKKIISIIIMSVIILSMSILNVYAIKSVSMRISPSKGEVKQGESITFTFSTADLELDANDQGIQGISGTIDINKNVFEDISLENSFEGLNGWDVNNYNASTGYVQITRTTFGTTAGDVFSITAKVKSNATVGITPIKFKDVSVVPASFTEYKLATEVLTQVNIASSNIVVPSPSPSPTPSSAIVNPYTSPTPSPTPSSTIVNPVNTTPSTVPSTKPTTSPVPTTTISTNGGSNIPHAGNENLIIPAIIIVAIFAIVMYTKYKKLD